MLFCLNKIGVFTWHSGPESRLCSSLQQFCAAPCGRCCRSWQMCARRAAATPPQVTCWSAGRTAWSPPPPAAWGARSASASSGTWRWEKASATAARVHLLQLTFSTPNITAQTIQIDFKLRLTVSAVPFSMLMVKSRKLPLKVLQQRTLCLFFKTSEFWGEFGADNKTLLLALLALYLTLLWL